jgi:hypothetical protein
LQPRKRTENVAIREIVDGRARALHGRLDQLGVLVLGLVARRPEQELVPSMLDCVGRRARVDSNDPACPYVDARRRFSEVHRELTGPHDERLLLDRVAMTAPLRARLVPPDVAPYVGA